MVNNEDTELSIGDIVGDSQRMVIAYTKKSDRIPNDSYASWLTICAKEGEFHPYVVWDVVARPEGFVAQNGTYAKTLEEALGYYHERGGNKIWTMTRPST